MRQRASPCVPGLLTSVLALAGCGTTTVGEDVSSGLDAGEADALVHDASDLSELDAAHHDASNVDGAIPDASRLDAAVVDATGSRLGFSLRFFGYGRDAVDRVVFPLDAPARPIDVGESDFTLEFFARMRPGDNATTGCRAENDGWIRGHALLDRDVYGAGDLGDFGLSIFEGRVAFGISRGEMGAGLCGTRRIDDDRWHHVAVTRDGRSGEVVLFVDGVRDASARGPAGDVRYRDGRTTSWPFDPTLVLGAEKHDAGEDYPSFRGWLDELRLSTVIRYREPFVPPSAPFVPDGETAGLYHFDEGEGAMARDASGGGSDGVLRVGGSGPGPMWSRETPFDAP